MVLRLGIHMAVTGRSSAAAVMQHTFPQPRHLPTSFHDGCCRAKRQDRQVPGAVLPDKCRHAQGWQVTPLCNLRQLPAPAGSVGDDDVLHCSKAGCRVLCVWMCGLQEMFVI